MIFRESANNEKYRSRSPLSNQFNYMRIRKLRNKMEMIIAMSGWIISVILFFSGIYYLFFVKWGKSQNRTKEKHTKI